MNSQSAQIHRLMSPVSYYKPSQHMDYTLKSTAKDQAGPDSGDKF